jgi:hypothetical protein
VKLQPLYFLALGTAFVTALLATPQVRRLALKVGVLDAVGDRRMHDGAEAAHRRHRRVPRARVRALRRSASRDTRSSTARTTRTTSSACSSAAR